jgi:hypothetical protein
VPEGAGEKGLRLELEGYAEGKLVAARKVWIGDRGKPAG